MRKKPKTLLFDVTLSGTNILRDVMYGLLNGRYLEMADQTLHLECSDWTILSCDNKLVLRSCCVACNTGIIHQSISILV
jgi:hypothetical protein